MRLPPNDKSRHEFYDPEAIQHENLDKLGMRYPQSKIVTPINRNTTGKCKKNQY